MSPNARLILYHKHSSSGRTVFLRLNDTVCQFEGIPTAAQVVESHLGGNQVQEDVTQLVTDAEQHLGMPQGTLTIDPEFKAAIADAETSLQIYLARFTAIDAPEEQVADQDGKFIALTEARRLPPTELELLRLAYTAIMDDLA
jgi:hypothetical protein